MLELTMAAVSGAETGAGATAGMLMAETPSEPGAVLCVGRDRNVCRLVTPDDWLFVSRTHLEFRCGSDGAWSVRWLRGSNPDPASEVRVVSGGTARALAYGGSAPLARGGSGEVVIQDRSGPRSVNVGYFHEG
ncbi:FHA domain-containing protein [Streptomyces sp. NPDC048518]|uniref:FHA domain-containing protein n=1 Tax=Streptomyces sp. NPDC048518 TaxID=3155029 RepID=UPI0033CBBA21